MLKVIPHVLHDKVIEQIRKAIFLSVIVNETNTVSNTFQADKYQIYFRLICGWRYIY